MIKVKCVVDNDKTNVTSLFAYVTVTTEMILLVLVVLFIVFLIFYSKSKYFTLRGPIPGEKPHFLVGNLIQSGFLFGGVSIPGVFAKWKERFGDVFQFYAGSTHMIVVNNLIDVEHIFTHRNIYDQGDFYVQQMGLIIPNALITNRGQRYRRHAALAVPLFRYSRIISNFDLIVDSTLRLLSRWQKNPADHIYFNMIEESQRLLLTIIGFVAFDFDLEVLKEKISEENNELTGALKDFLDKFNNLAFLPLPLAKVFFKLNRNFHRAQRILDKHFDRMIEQELKKTEYERKERKRTSLIAALVNSLKKDENSSQGLSRCELLDDMRLYLSAGFETGTTVLSWFIHLMSKNPQVQQKIKIELKNENENDDLTLSRIENSTYLDCVLKEVLRFCPPVNGTLRTLTTDDRLPNSGTRLYKGDQILIPFHNLSHDRRYWKIDPERFYPERFLLEDKNHPNFASIPFGQGHRQCIGQDLARFELKAIMATLMKYVTFKDAGPEINAGGHLSNMTIMPKRIAVLVDFDDKDVIFRENLQND